MTKEHENGHLSGKDREEVLDSTGLSSPKFFEVVRL